MLSGGEMQRSIQALASLQELPQQNTTWRRTVLGTLAHSGSRFEFRVVFLKFPIMDTEPRQPYYLPIVEVSIFSGFSSPRPVAS